MPRKKLPVKQERMIHVRLTGDLHKKLKIEVAHKGQTIQDWVSRLIDKNLSRGTNAK